MDMHDIRREILRFIRSAAPGPCNADRIAEALDCTLGIRRTRDEVVAICRDLEQRGYITNLKHRSDPVYKGVSGTAQDQLDKCVTLDPGLYGDAAL